MDTFAFIIHPIDSKKDISRKYPVLGLIVNNWMIKHISPIFPPVVLSSIEGIRSKSSQKDIKGWLLACPLSPSHFMELPERLVYKKVIETGRVAERLGAKILGLGAYTSVVGDAGITIARELEIPVTTGDAYTIAVTIQAVKLAAKKMNIALSEAAAAVVGATGAIGRTCAYLLSHEVEVLYLVGRDQERLETLRSEISNESNAHVYLSTDLNILTRADVILGVTNANKSIIESKHLSPGSIVCDVARPRDVSPSVLATRPDVLVIDGGIVDVPGEVDFHFDFGLPPGKAYACMAETMALALEGYFFDYTLGKNILLSRVIEISKIAEKHGFRLSTIRSLGQTVTEEKIESIQMNARRSRSQIHWMGG